MDENIYMELWKGGDDPIHLPRSNKTISRSAVLDGLVRNSKLFEPDEIPHDGIMAYELLWKDEEFAKELN